MNGIIQWFESNMQLCWWKSTLHMDCPGCGLQRSFVLLLKGEWTESFVMFPALIPTLFMFAFLVVHLIFKFEKGAKVIVINFIIVAAIMAISFIIKQIMLFTQ